MQWAEYRSFLLWAGWGYAHRNEVQIASQAVRMQRTKAMYHIEAMTACRDSRLRIAALMRVMNQPMITMRFAVTALGWDVMLYLPRENGAAVTDYVLSTAEGRTGSISGTYLNLMLTEAELYMDRSDDFAKARRVCSWGLSLLRDGIQVESDVQDAFASESRKVGHLLKVRYEGESSDASRDSEGAMVDGLVRVQQDFNTFMGLMQGVSLN